MKDIINKLDNILNEGQLGQMADRVELDHEVQMARADLYKLAKYSIKLHDMLKNVSEVNGIDGWQASKITQAADYIGSVYHAMDAESTDAEAEMDALADVIMPDAVQDHKVCADCGDEMHEPTTDCMHDSHDEYGENWVNASDIAIIPDELEMSDDVSELAKLSGITKEAQSSGTTGTNGEIRKYGKPPVKPDVSLGADTTTGQEPDVEAEAQAILDKMTSDQQRKALDMKPKGDKLTDSKFSDWGKK